jgi:hypothetical protein
MLSWFPAGLQLKPATFDKVFKAVTQLGTLIVSNWTLPVSWFPETDLT